MPGVIFLATVKMGLAKAAKPCQARNFRGIFGTEDVVLLAQDKDDKPKSTEKGRQAAVEVRLSHAYAPAASQRSGRLRYSNVNCSPISSASGIAPAAGSVLVRYRAGLVTISS